MNIGKIPNDILEKLLYKNIGKKQPEILVGPGIGKDCGVIDFGDDVCVISTDPITGAVNKIGYLAIHISCNDVATTGTKPIGAMVTIIAPANTQLTEIQSIMEDINRAANELDLEIIGGHTEVSPAVNQVVISVTALGKIAKEKLVHPGKAQVGDDILVTKTAGLEGTAIIAMDREDILARYFSRDFIDRASRFIEEISVVKEGLIAGKFGAHAMHDATEGGILGALWEMSKAMNKGFEVDINKIPIAKETRKICKIFDIDPLRLISSGSMIIVTPDGEQLLKLLSNAGVSATIIGKVVGGTTPLVIYDGEKHVLEPPESDELYKAINYRE
ncbi:MAG: AIR synthase family protein [Caldicoprobacterales bacterium]|jgi:hydrogenase expression/formation protein HypE